MENVFVEAPASGTWEIKVILQSIGADGNVDYVNDDPSECIPNPTTCIETGSGHPVDAVFALVVSLDPDCNENEQSDLDEILLEDVGDCDHDGIPDTCEAGACCIGESCTDTLSECECAAQPGPGLFFGVGVKCNTLGPCESYLTGGGGEE